MQPDLAGLVRRVFLLNNSVQHDSLKHHLKTDDMGPPALCLGCESWAATPFDHSDNAFLRFLDMLAFASAGGKENSALAGGFLAHRQDHYYLQR